MKKICLAELRKLIKQKEQEAVKLVECLGTDSVTVYSSTEDKLASDFNLNTILTNIDNINSEVQRLKDILSNANNVIKINEDLTLYKALIKLAQLNTLKSTLSTMPTIQIKRNGTTFRSEIIEFTEANYDVQELKSYLEKVENEISTLQIAIDRANLIGEVEI